MPSAMTLSLKARFYARATPLVTTTGVIQTHRRKKTASLKNLHDSVRLLFRAQLVFLVFSFSQCEIPTGLMVGLHDFWQGACSLAESRKTQHQRPKSQTDRKGFLWFLLTSETKISILSEATKNVAGRFGGFGNS